MRALLEVDARRAHLRAVHHGDRGALGDVVGDVLRLDLADLAVVEGDVPVEIGAGDEPLVGDHRDVLALGTQPIAALLILLVLMVTALASVFSWREKRAVIPAVSSAGN